MEPIENSHEVFDKIRTLESWMRRVIWYVKSEKTDFENKSTYIKIKGEANKLQVSNPEKYPRWVDALHFIEALTLIALIKDLQDLDPVLAKFIKGKRESLNDTRNNLFHHRAISTKCLNGLLYISDSLIELIQKYFMEENREREFNVPTIVFVRDGWGRELNRTSNLSFPEKTIYVGDKIDIRVEIDSSYSNEDYSLTWLRHNSGMGVMPTIAKDTNHLEYEISDSDVSVLTIIRCRVIQSKGWHKHGNYDDELSIPFKILPKPLEG